MTAGRIFVSYRRDDVAHAAGRLAVSLQERGVGEIFVDVSIGIGQNFVRRIREEISASDVVLVLIGRNWLGIAGDDGRRRIDSERDWVHLEVRTALERGVLVVPVLIDGASMPDPSDLPEPLRDLVYLQAGSVSAMHWDRDINWLAEQLAPSKGTPTAPTRAAQRAQGAAPARGRDDAGVVAAAPRQTLLDQVSGWTPAAAAELYRRLVADGSHVQAGTILAEVPAGGWCDRSTVYQLGGFPDHRTLKGFTRPVARAMQRMEQEGILPAAAANPMLPTYDSTDGTQTADGFHMPEELVRVFREGLAVGGPGEETPAAAAHENARLLTADATKPATGGADGVAEHLRQLNPDQQVADLVRRVANLREVRSEHRGYVSIAPVPGRGIALYVHRFRISIALPPDRADEVLLSFPNYTYQRKSPATTYVVVHATALRGSFDGALGLALEAIDWRSRLDHV